MGSGTIALFADAHSGLARLHDSSHEGSHEDDSSLPNQRANRVPREPISSVHDADPASIGQWSKVITAPVVPIHMHMLPTGQVMFWDRHGPGWDGNPYLWNPSTGIFTPTATVPYDIFCAGHSFLADGRLLVTGGHIADHIGAKQTSIYDPFADTWQAVPDMNAGRWYPTNVTLTNGDIVVMAGTYEQGVNFLPQVYTAETGTWRNLSAATLDRLPNYADFYPFLYVAPNGLVFDAGPQQTARYLDPTGFGQWTDVATSTLAYRDYGSSVMYDGGKVLIVGGNLREPDSNAPSTILPSASAEVIDLNASTPTWRVVESMHIGRRHHNATLLPDGTVLVTGGSSAPGHDNPDGAVLAAEIWEPATETWRVVAPHTRYRGYHSVALLLPDGRVLVGGGGHPDPATGAEPNFEIYSPPYLFQGPRPVISDAPLQVRYDQPFFIATADATAIAQVNWVRLSSVTHAFNQHQRFNHLEFSPVAGGLQVTLPANPHLAPPGHYMLFILNAAGTPSAAHIVQLLPNDAPVVMDATWNTPEDTPLTLDLLASATDADEDHLTIQATTLPTTGTVTTDGATAIYTPSLDYNGTASFAYTVTDGIWTSMASATVNMTAINDAPTVSAIEDQQICADGTVLTIPLTIGDVDTHFALNVSATTSNASLLPNSAIMLYGTGNERTLRLRPTAAVTGIATVTVTVSDGQDHTSRHFAVTTRCQLHLPTMVQ